MIVPGHDDSYNRRMTKAASALVIRLPFFGYLLLGSSVRIVESDEPTMSTDGLKIYCGIEFVLKEELDIVTFGLLHELLHIFFNHHARRGSRIPKIWNIAVDIFTNGQCMELLGTDSPKGFVSFQVPPRFIQWQPWAAGKTVEEIYDIIMKMAQQDPSTPDKLLPEKADQGVGDGSDLRPPPVNADPLQGPQGNTEWQEQFRQDVSYAKALSEKSVLHKPLSDTVQSRMDKVLRPTLPWGSLIRGGLSTDLGWDEATYAPPKVKYYPIILPQTRRVKERTLLLGIDVSASVTDELIRIFITNVQAAAHRATKTVIVTFDQVVREVYETTQPRHIFDHVKFNSGAHSYTSALGVFENADRVRPSAICVLTDGYIELPEKPYRKTTFVIPTGGRTPPWGTTYVMEYPW